MYVTRRFLRSTMTPDASDAHEEPTAAPARETSRRRASPASAKRKSEAMPVEKVASGSVASSRSVAASSKKKAAAAAASTEPLGDAEETRQKAAQQFVGYGMLVDARDSLERWCEAKIVDLDAAAGKVFVHYVGWNARYDAWLSVAFLAAHGSHTGAESKSTSWNGSTPLFASAADGIRDGFDQQQQQEGKVAHEVTANVKEKKEKKASKKDKSTCEETKASPPEASKKRRSRTDSSQPQDAEELRLPDSTTTVVNEDEGEQPTPRKRARRASRKAAAAVESSGPKDAPPKATKKLRGAKVQPLRVGVATTDEASERKARRSRKQKVDMELDMDVRDDDAAGDEVATSTADNEELGDVDVGDDGEPGKRGGRKAFGARKARGKMKQRGGEASNGEAATPTAVPVSAPPSTAAPKRGGRTRQSNSASQQTPRAPVVLSETREKLATIFRLRLQQRQQLEQLMGCDPSLDITSSSLQEEDVVVGNGDREKQADMEGAASAAAVSASSAEAAAQEAYIHFHHAQQIQQYYYQQAMLAARANAVDAGDDAALQGGIIDSRIIHAGVDALEQQRRVRQQQCQDYYQHMALTRERNMQALASNQDFLTKSGQAWQHQQAGDEVMIGADTTGDGENSQASTVDALTSESTEVAPKTDAVDGVADSGHVASSGDAADAAEATTAKHGDTDDSSASALAVKSGEHEGDETASEAAIAATGTRTDGEKGSVLYEFVL